MPPFHETSPEAYAPTKPDLKVDGGDVTMPLGIARDVHRVTKGMMQDAEVIDLESDHLRTADQLSVILANQFRTARLLERGTINLPVSDLEVVVGGAKAVLAGYSERKANHLEDKSIPEHPESLTGRARKLGAEAVASCMVAAGRFSRTGRSARRLERALDEPTLKSLEAKSKAQKRRRRLKKPKRPSIDEWTVALAAKDEQNSDEPPATW